MISFINLLWIVFIVFLLVFIILISCAATYQVENCDNRYECEEELSITPSYTTRKNLLFAANICGWIVIVLYVCGIIIYPISKSKLK